MIMHSFGYQTLPVRVFEYFPRCGDPGERLTAQIEKCPELMNLNLKLAIGMKLLDTVQWLSARGYIQLSAILPKLDEIGWFDNKPPLYVVSVAMEGNMEIPIRNWCFGDFMYNEIPIEINISTSGNINLDNTNNTNNTNDNNLNLDLNHSNVSTNLVNNNSELLISSSNFINNNGMLMNPTSALFNEYQPLFDYNLNGLLPMTYDLHCANPPQPRLRMGTFMSHLRHSLETTNYYPGTNEYINNMNINHSLPHTLPNTSINNPSFLNYNQYSNNNPLVHNNNVPINTSIQLNQSDLDNNNIQYTNLNLASENQNSNSKQGNENKNKESKEKKEVSNPTPSLDVPQQKMNMALAKTHIKISDFQRMPVNNESNVCTTSSESNFTPITLSSPDNNIINKIQSTNGGDKCIAKKDIKEVNDSKESNEPPFKRKRGTTTNISCHLRNQSVINFKEDSSIKNDKNSNNKTKDDKKVKRKQSPVNKENEETITTKEIKAVDFQTNYHAVLNRAELVFESNIEDLTENWSEEEIKNGRRLVQFDRKHENNILYCSFKVLTQAEYEVLLLNAKKEKNTPFLPFEHQIVSIISSPQGVYYITSVDLVNLLEYLLQVIFTLEEKNRIRRNLELFFPITISRNQTINQVLFKKIMDFPNPKPRNISKGIKIFPTTSLIDALRKVVGKHTASRSSTLMVNLRPLAN